MNNCGISNVTFFLASILAAIVLLWRGWSRRRDASHGDRLVRAFLILGCALVAIFCLPSLLAIQKFLTKLVIPPGLLWLGLILVGCSLWRYHLRTLSTLVWIMWLLLTISGSDTVSRRLLAGLESEFAKIDPLAVASPYDPFDLVISLGGATQVTPAGQIEVTETGDRIVLAARLYHAGHAKMLIATGRPNEEILGPGRHPAEEARALWQDLGVPKDAILVFGGATTKEEFELIAHESEKRGWKRIGVITSAWHLQRSMRLANAAGVDVEPLPADFVGVAPTWDRTSIVPRGQALQETSRAIKECLARLVGR